MTAPGPSLLHGYRHFEGRIGSEMAALNVEKVLNVHHWNDTLFSFKTTRSPSLRFENGQFLMIGLEVAGRPLLRAYSIASANHEEHL